MDKMAHRILPRTLAHHTISMRNKLTQIFNSVQTRNALLLAHVLVIALAFIPSYPPAPDQETYFALSDGLTLGSFSVWNGIIDPAPQDLLRTHGYPVFLYLVRSVSDQPNVLFAIQSILYFVTLLLIMALLEGGSERLFRQSIFLLLMLPQFQLVYYIHQVFPETLMALLCAWFVRRSLEGRPGAGPLIGTGILAAVLFWVRPVMLFLPLFMIILDLVFAPQRVAQFKRNAGVFFLFVLFGPLPFACWNLSTHGTFMPIPLSGSAVNSNLGIWQLRLPGYGTMHYFQYNYFGREFLPLVSEDEAAAYYEEYQTQWVRIEKESANAMTEEDRRNQVAMDGRKTALYATRSPAYTMALNDAIAKENAAMIKADPFYYLGSRCYAAVRLWVTNINMPMEKVVYEPTPGVRPIVGKPTGMGGWAAALVPFLLTVITFGLGLPLVAWSVLRDPGWWRPRRYVLYMICYVWFVHIPMSIQSRYTVPVHALAIACVTWAIVTWRPSTERKARTEEGLA